MMQKAITGDVHSEQTNELEIIIQLKEKYSTARSDSFTKELVY